MRGTDEKNGSLFSYVDLEERIPARHPLRKIRQVVNDALASLDEDFDHLYVDFGRPSIAPERLIRASRACCRIHSNTTRRLLAQRSRTDQEKQMCTTNNRARGVDLALPRTPCGLVASDSHASLICFSAGFRAPCELSFSSKGRKI